MINVDINAQMTQLASTEQLKELQDTQSKLVMTSDGNKNQIEMNKAKGEANGQEIASLKQITTDLNEKIGNVPTGVTTRLDTLESIATADEENEEQQYDRIETLEMLVKKLINNSKDAKGGEESHQQQCTYTCKPSHGSQMYNKYCIFPTVTLYNYHKTQISHY